MRTHKTPPTTIDTERCTGCGRCVRICPDDTLALVNKKAEVVSDECLVCGHCVAICPEDAVSVRGLSPAVSQLETLSVPDAQIGGETIDPATLIQLLASRRSSRDFTAEPVPSAVLRDLARVGAMAPSGTNCQRWRFTLLSRREQVVALGDRLGRFFRGLNGLSDKGAARLVSRALPGDPIGMWHREYRDKVAEALDEWDRDGTDRLFHHAPALILVSSRRGASTPKDDALLATQNILLAAHAMGLGTCLIGFAVIAMQIDRRVNAAVGLPWREKVEAAIALGHSRERWTHTAPRGPAPIREL
jgi:nitroreductase/NAD-dependent dihydropyrimidine dehydrogenase PreA subunit